MRIEATDFDLNLDYGILVTRYWRIIKTMVGNDKFYFDDKIIRFKRDKLLVKFQNCFEYGYQFFSIKVECGGEVSLLVVHTEDNPYEYRDLFVHINRQVMHGDIAGYPQEELNSEILQFVDDYLMDN